MNIFGRPAGFSIARLGNWSLVSLLSLAVLLTGCPQDQSADQDTQAMAQTAPAHPSAGAHDIRSSLFSFAHDGRGIGWIRFEVTRHDKSMRACHERNGFAISPAYSAAGPLDNDPDVRFPAQFLTQRQTLGVRLGMDDDQNFGGPLTQLTADLPHRFA